MSSPYEEYPPGETNHEHEGRHARHGAHQQYEDEYEQPGGAYGQHEYAYRRPDPAAYREPERYQSDQTHQYNEHGLDCRKEQRTQEPYGPIDAGPAHEDAYAAPQETYALPEVGYADQQYYPHDDLAGHNDYRHDEPDTRHVTPVEGGQPRGQLTREFDTRPRQARQRRRLIAVVGLALGTLLCALAFLWGSDRSPEGGLPLSTATIPPGSSAEPIALPDKPSAVPSSVIPRTSSAAPRTTPSAMRPAAPSAAPSVTHSATSPPTPTPATPTQTQSSSPLLLGPSNDGVKSMVQQYCDQHGGGSAEPRNDSGWQCRQLLFASVVDMDVACRDTYGSGAYARTLNSEDPYAWRCYR
ncbi:hypothetical protein [Micromonospora sp. M71_S20]|uniref:hypothetical protein n=1 Tax=Micromonospora sp. M71_S20 TaxID=592872 RepID=UPI000EB59EA2|nr:hypothetical protein [Micromonospora sp. M71_S20]